MLYVVICPSLLVVTVPKDISVVNCFLGGDPRTNLVPVPVPKNDSVLFLQWQEQWKYNELTLFAGVKLKLPCLLYLSYPCGIYKTTDWDMDSFRCSCLPCWSRVYLWQLVFYCNMKWLGVDTSELFGISWICGQKANSLYGLSSLSTFFKEVWLGQIATGCMSHGCAKAEESCSLLFFLWINQEWEGSYRARHNHISRTQVVKA